MKRNSLLLIAAVVLALAGCEKNSANVTEKTRSDQITFSAEFTGHKTTRAVTEDPGRNLIGITCTTDGVIDLQSDYTNVPYEMGRAGETLYPVSTRRTIHVPAQGSPGADLDGAHPGTALKHGRIVLLDNIPQLNVPVGGQGAQIQSPLRVKGVALKFGDALDIHHLGRPVLSAMHIYKHVGPAGHHFSPLRFQPAGLLNGPGHVKVKFRKHRRAPF